MYLTLNTRSTEYDLARILYIECLRVSLHNGDGVLM